MPRICHAAVIVTSMAVLLTAAGTARAGVLHLRTCSEYRDNAAGAWSASSKGVKMSSANACGEGGSLRLIASGGAVKNDYAKWATTSPEQISMTNVSISSADVLINPKAKTAGYGGKYVWTGGVVKIGDTGKRCCGGMDYGSGISAGLPSSDHWFAIRIACDVASCTGVSGQVLDIKGIELTATDFTPPTIKPDETTTNIANEAGRWIRGSWDASFTADSEDGVCTAAESVNGSVVARGVSYTPKTGSWTQCGQGAGELGGSGADVVSHTIDTTADANGPLKVKYSASDAAQPANVAAPVYDLKVDNSPVTLGLSGPTQALTTSGPQSVIARATAGPSGVSGIWCSVDGKALTEHRAASEGVAVSTPGQNTVACFARNNAVNSSGQPAQSPVETWSVDIRKPSVNRISLVHVADRLRCARKELRIHVPAHWTLERVHGHWVRVRVPAQMRSVEVEHCHPRVRASGSYTRLRFGARPTVSGWLGDPDGNALAGQTVEVLAAPADGIGHFTLLKTVRTAATGLWTAHLPSGPSRLIEAVYGGSSQSAPSTSNIASVAVKAAPSLRIQPRHTHWGDTIRISGRLRGGYIPASGELVVLKIGWHGGSAEIGQVYTDAAGRFFARYTFLRGTGSETYRIWAQTVRESDYPFSPARSRRVRISVHS